jgi:hypothetical protein
MLFNRATVSSDGCWKVLSFGITWWQVNPYIWRVLFLLFAVLFCVLFSLLQPPNVPKGSGGSRSLREIFILLMSQPTENFVFYFVWSELDIWTLFSVSNTSIPLYLFGIDKCSEFSAPTKIPRQRFTMPTVTK